VTVSAIYATKSQTRLHTIHSFSEAEAVKTEAIHNFNLTAYTKSNL